MVVALVVNDHEEDVELLVLQKRCLIQKNYMKKETKELVKEKY